jgi:hypothetical protein
MTQIRYTESSASRFGNECFWAPPSRWQLMLHEMGFTISWQSAQSDLRKRAHPQPSAEVPTLTAKAGSCTARDRKRYSA